MKIVAIIILMSAAIAFFASRRKIVATPGTLGLNAGNVGRAARKANNPSIAPRNPWRAISIVPGECACDAVKAIGDRRFLETERKTPALPVPGCDVDQCNCRYARHQDRRQFDEDRRQPASLQSQLYDKTEDTERRKKKRGRRKGDWA